MLKLRIRKQDNTYVQLGGVVDLQPTGTIDGYVKDRAAVLESPRQLGHAEWYSRLIGKKLAAMTSGGTYPNDDHLETSPYSFSKGLEEVYPKPYLQTFQHINPIDGEFWILPGKTVDVTESDDGGISVTLPVHHKQPDKTFIEIDKLLWRLYHCVNSLNGRLQIFDPRIPKDGDPAISNMGPYLGTYLQYQAMVARWNMFAWDSSFMLEVNPAGERATIVMGYTNLNCYENGPITMTCIITLVGTNDPGTGEEYSASPLTIYNQGADSNIDENNVNITTEFTRNDKVTSGSGYEFEDPGALTSAGLEVLLEAKSADTPIMTAEQYYRAIAAIAPSVGVDFEYTVQEGTPTVFHTLNILATWEIGNKVYSKTAEVKIAAVGRLKETSNT